MLRVKVFLQGGGFGEFPECNDRVREQGFGKFIPKRVENIDRGVRIFRHGTTNRSLG